MSPYLTNCNDLYTYDWHGNFQGVNSAVIDLTLGDDPLPTKKIIKKEPGASNKTAPTTMPAKRKPRKVKVCDEIPVQSSEISVSKLDTDHDGSKVRRNCRRRKFSSSDFEVTSESEHLKEDKRSRTKKAVAKTVNKSSAVAAVIGSDGDNEARCKARQAAPSGGRKREKNEKTSRKRAASGGGSARDSDATESKQRVRQPSGNGRKRERTASGGSRESDLVQSNDHIRQQPGRGGKRDRTASSGGKKTLISSAGGKEKGREMDALSPLLSPAKDEMGWRDVVEESKVMAHVHLGKSRDRKEHKPGKMAAVRPSDTMDAFSPLLSPMKKKSILWGGGVGERKSNMSSAIVGPFLGEPMDDLMTQSQLRNLRQ
jgi:hypothetical protein